MSTLKRYLVSAVGHEDAPDFVHSIIIVAEDVFSAAKVARLNWSYGNLRLTIGFLNELKIIYQDKDNISNE